MLKTIEERKLPELLTREEMLRILQHEEYGFIPPAPEKISFTKNGCSFSAYTCCAYSVGNSVYTKNS